MARKKASIMSFLFGMLFGIIVLLGGVAYGGYWAYNNLSVNEFERLSRQKITFIGEESVLRTKAIKDLINDVQEIPGLTFTQFSDKYQISLPDDIAFVYEALDDVVIKDLSVNTLLERVKVGYILGSPYNGFENFDEDAEAPEGAEKLMWGFRNYTIMGANGLQTYIDGLTVGSLKDVFGFELPSFLALDDDTLISEIGNEIDNMYVSDLLEELMGDTALSDPLSDTIFQALIGMEKGEGENRSPYKISEFGEMFNALPDEIEIRSIINEPILPEGEDEYDNPMDRILINIIKDKDTGTYYKLSEINDVVSGLGDKILLKDIIKEPVKNEETNEYDNPVDRILIKILQDEEGEAYTLNDADTVFAGLGDDILLKDIIAAPTGTGIAATIITKLRDPETPGGEDYYSINDIDTVMNGLPGKITLEEILTVPAEEGIGKTIVQELIGLRDGSNNPYTIANINEAIQELPGKIKLSQILSTAGMDGIGFAIVDKLMTLKDGNGDDYTIANISDAINELPQKLEIRDIITTDGLTSPNDDIAINIINKISLLDYDGDPETDDFYKLSDIGKAMGKLPGVLTLSDVMTAPTGNDIFSNIFNKLMTENKTISELSTLDDDDFLLSDVFESVEGDTIGARIINFFAGSTYTLGQIDTALNDITMGVLFSDNPKIMCLFGADVKLSEIGNVDIAAVLGEKQIGELVSLGILPNIDEELWDLTLNELIENVNTYAYLLG